MRLTLQQYVSASARLGLSNFEIRPNPTTFTIPRQGVALKVPMFKLDGCEHVLAPVSDAHARYTSILKMWVNSPLPHLSEKYVCIIQSVT